MSTPVHLDQDPAAGREIPLATMRHSAAHVMAAAVVEMFPDAALGIGPATEDGFYYDFDLPRSLTPEDFPEIERRMTRLIAEDHPFIRRVISRPEARQIFADQPYKLEIVDELPPDATITTYQMAQFVDLCRGPHVASTGQIGAVKIMSVAAAYWRGDEKRPQLQRLYGTAFAGEVDLEAYLWRLEEAKKRDHRRLGKELDLFSISEEVGPGLILWHPRGAMARVLAED
ncbi:MAG: threonine--tRNA ligase, partial [Chloroflexi bacterium]|nr:threonine--tRNA ligase [Chloroflexota bacterium]